MLAERPPSNDWAYAEDIPGSRCDPEDGPWPRPYQVLKEDELWSELKYLAKPRSFTFDGLPHTQTQSQTKNTSPSPTKGWKADALNFQPSTKAKTQDRYVVTQLEIHGRMWGLTGVFDGHLGDVTVDHVAHHLPIIIKEQLLLLQPRQSDPTYIPPPNVIAETFSRAVVAFDHAIANDVLDLFGGIEGLDNFSDAEIRGIINDQHRGGANWKKARLCMYGTTALVALVDPERKNLWIANLGDCQAIMVSGKNDVYSVETLTNMHNGYNDAELERIRRAHPGEPECILDRRVLGALAPTRCLGDIPFKQPASFTRRILYNLSPGFHNTSPWEEFLLRNISPPYITAEPEIIHRRLDADGLGEGVERWLILASDGFTDLCDEEGQDVVLSSWAASTHSSSSPISPTSPTSPFSPLTPSTHIAHSPTSSISSNSSILSISAAKNNLALQLLRRALGGEDTYAVSKALTLDMDVAWIDDTSIVVQAL